MNNYLNVYALIVANLIIFAAGYTLGYYIGKWRCQKDGKKQN